MGKRMSNELLADILKNSKAVADLHGSIIAATTPMLVLKVHGVGDERERVRAAACLGVKQFKAELDSVIERLASEGVAS